MWCFFFFFSSFFCFFCLTFFCLPSTKNITKTHNITNCLSKTLRELILVGTTHLSFQLKWIFHFFFSRSPPTMPTKHRRSDSRVSMVIELFQKLSLFSMWMLRMIFILTLFILFNSIVFHFSFSFLIVFFYFYSLFRCTYLHRHGKNIVCNLLFFLITNKWLLFFFERFYKVI